jgi:hypothetical protein
MDENGSGSCPVAGCGITGVETLVSPAAMLISYENHKGKLSTVPSAMYVD